jgi:hypothetical protein
MLADIASFCLVPLRADAKLTLQQHPVAPEPVSVSIQPLSMNLLAALRPDVPRCRGASSVRGAGMMIENIAGAAMLRRASVPDGRR